MIDPVSGWPPTRPPRYLFSRGSLAARRARLLPGRRIELDGHNVEVPALFDLLHLVHPHPGLWIRVGGTAHAEPIADVALEIAGRRVPGEGRMADHGCRRQGHA